MCFEDDILGIVNPILKEFLLHNFCSSFLISYMTQKLHIFVVNQCYFSLNYYLIVMSVLKKVNNVRKYNNWLITLCKQVLNFKYSKRSVIKLFWKVYKKYIFIVDMRMAASWISYGEIERIDRRRCRRQRYSWWNCWTGLNWACIPWLQ